MGFLDWLGGKAGNKSTGKMPWDEKPSIYQHILAHVKPDQPGLDEKGFVLPDNERARKQNQVAWGPGAKDGVLSFHTALKENPKLNEKLFKLIKSYCAKPSLETKKNIYNSVVNEDAITLVDALIKNLVGEPSLNHQQLSELAYSFVTESPDREPVKLSIALLGLFQSPQIEELLQVIGRHDEFTLFCSIAMLTSMEDPTEAVWKLSKNVSGWGRIHTVYHLANSTDPKIKHWLLTEGYKNTVMTEYVALVCAQSGELDKELGKENVDEKTVIAAGDLISALINGGPAEDINQYKQGAFVTEKYLQKLNGKTRTITDFSHVKKIKDFLTQKNTSWEVLEENGWTREIRDSLLKECELILSHSNWVEITNIALNSGVDSDLHDACSAAKELNIETWDVLWERLLKNPKDSSLWGYITDQCNESRLEKILQLAEEQIDVSSTETDSSNEDLSGSEFEKYSILDFILQMIADYPGQGEALVKAGLKSSWIRNRYKAMATVQNWGKENCSDSLLESVSETFKTESDEELSKQMEQFLNN